MAQPRFRLRQVWSTTGARHAPVPLSTTNPGLALHRVGRGAPRALSVQCSAGMDTASPIHYPIHNSVCSHQVAQRVAEAHVAHSRLAFSVHVRARQAPDVASTMKAELELVVVVGGGGCSGVGQKEESTLLHSLPSCNPTMHARTHARTHTIAHIGYTPGSAARQARAGCTTERRGVKAGLRAQ